MQGFLDQSVPRYAPYFEQARVEQAATTYFFGIVLKCDQSPEQYGYIGTRNVYIPVSQPCTTSSTKQQTGTLNACVSDPNEFAYVSGGGNICPWEPTILPWNQQRAISGPNLNCPSAMLGLSSSPKQIMEKLDHMYPVPGGTQMDVGLMWGLRVLSDKSQWTSFWGYGPTYSPSSFGSPSVRKIMIVLTDGVNTAPYHYEGYYGCNEGNERNDAGGCWRQNDVKALNRNALDNLTLDACSAIRNDYGVEIFTIAVDVTDPAAQTLLQNCAGAPGNAFNVTSGQLNSVFAELAQRTIHLSK